MKAAAGRAAAQIGNAATVAKRTAERAAEELARRRASGGSCSERESRRSERDVNDVLDVPEAPIGRLYAPDDESCYVFVSSSRKHVLMISRRDNGLRVAHPREIDSLIGPPNARAKSCAVSAIVGLLSYPDDRSLVVVTRSIARPLYGASFEASVVRFVAKTGFLSMSDSGKSQWNGASLEARDAGAKMRMQLKELLEGGDFFFSADEALTLSLQRVTELLQDGYKPSTWAHRELRFCWNEASLKALAEAGVGPWLTPILQGALVSEQLELPNGLILRLSLISRRSCEHPGTRFKARGIDDSGACANFIESEQRVQLLVQRPPRAWAIASFVQLRGSAPLFWDQRGKAITPRPRLRRSVPLTLPALRRHLDELERHYGAVTFLSLLEHRGDEAKLNAALTQALAAVSDSHGEAQLASFDFRDKCRTSRQEGVQVLLPLWGEDGQREVFFPTWPSLDPPRMRRLSLTHTIRTLGYPRATVRVTAKMAIATARAAAEALISSSNVKSSKHPPFCPLTPLINASHSLPSHLYLSVDHRARSGATARRASLLWLLAFGR